MTRVTPSLVEELVACLLELRFGEPERQEQLWRLPALRQCRVEQPRGAGPRERLITAVTELDAALTRDADPLVALLRHAITLSAPERPQTLTLTRLTNQLDRRPCLDLIVRRGALRERRRELTVRLARRGDDVEASWYIGGRRLAVPPRTYPLAHLRSADLLCALFPPPTNAAPRRPDPEPIMGRLDAAYPSPLAHAVRLRVCLDDMTWAALPWEALALDGERLTGGVLPWTIERVRAVCPTVDVTVSRRPDVIVLEGAGVTAAGVKSALGIAHDAYAQGDRVVGVSSLDVLTATAAHHPGALVLAPTPAPADLARLAGLLAALPADDRPVALCLIGPPREAGGPAPTLPLLDGAPVVACPPDLDAAKVWLTKVAVHGWDPTVAAHDGEPIPIATAYATWSGSHLRRDEPPPPGLVLDRITQRNRVLDRLRLLLDPEGHHRVMVFVASGPPQNRVDQLAEQLEAHIAHALPELHLEIGRPALPREGDFQPKAAAEFYAAALADALRLHRGGGMPTLMRQLAAGHLPGSQRVIWLDWGAFGHDKQHPRLKRRELRGWLGWHVALADHARRADVRIAALIACQATNAAPIEQVVDEAVLGTDLPCVDFAALTPLKAVKRDELRQYLNTPHFSRAKPDQVGKLTRALDAAVPDGDFERLVTLLDRGLRIGWEDLLRDLTGPPEARPDDDEEIT